MARNRTALFLGGVCVFYAVWGLIYVQRTSAVINQIRVYTLWDDAMISMRYASNLSAGNGLVWNVGEEPIQGYTNLGVTLAMATVHLLPVGPLKISVVVQLLNLAGLLMIVVLVWSTASDLFPNRPGIPMASVLGIALSGPLAVWGLQGSDTTPVALWLMVAVAALARRARHGGDWPLWLWGWIALGPIIRLDCVIFSAVLVAGYWSYPSRTLGRLALGASCSGLVVVGLVIFSILYYGDPFPNTYYLKSTGAPRSEMLIAGALQLVLHGGGLLIALAIAAYGNFRKPHEPMLIQMLGLALIAVVYTLWVGGDWAPYNGIRFLVPILPIVLILATSACWRILAASEDERSGESGGIQSSRPIALTASLVVALMLNPWPALLEWFDLRVPTMFHADNARNIRYGLYFRDLTQPKTRVAVHWGGISPYISGRPAIDVLGKSDRHIARKKVTAFVPGHSKWDWDYVLSTTRPDLFVKTSRGLDERADFQSSYLGVTNRFGLPFFVRTDAVGLLKDPSVQLMDLRKGARAP